jgi:hypothetical protein
MKVVLVTHDGPFGRWLASSLWSAGAVDAVLVETGRHRARYYWRKLLRAGPRDFAFQAWLSRWYAREGARALSVAPMPPHERITSANTYAFDDDTLPLGFGTSYITAATLSRLPNGFLNLHTGYLPDYRGVKSDLGALSRGDVKRLGWTLHVMTPELDAGDIVLRRTVEWEGESAGAVRAKLLRDAAPAIAELLRCVRVEGVRAIPRGPQGRGAYYSTPRRADWLAYRRAIGR